MLSVRSLLVALFVLSASVAQAQSDGVPFIEGSWSGKIKATYWDQTNQGSNDPKQKYKDKVDVIIDQGVGDFDMNIEFKNGLPTGTGAVLTEAILDGNVGNGHLGVTRSLVTPILVGSGSVNKRANRIKITGVSVTDEYTVEFKITLRRTGN